MAAPDVDENGPVPSLGSPLRRSLRSLTAHDLVTAIAVRFAGADGAGMEAEIGETLEAVGGFANADRCSLHVFSNDRTTVERTYEWHAEGLSQPDDTHQGPALTSSPWVMQRLETGETIGLSDLTQLPPDAAAEQRLWRAFGLSSVLAVPLFRNEVLAGCLALSLPQPGKAWCKDDRRLLTLVGEVLLGALARAQAEEALRRRLAAEETVAAISNRLIRVGADQMESEIGWVLGTLGNLLGADRCSLALVSADRSRIEQVYQWCATGIVSNTSVYQGLSLAPYPWLREKLDSLDTSRSSCFDDLPPSADAEKTLLQSLDVQGGVAVPLSRGPSVAGFLGISALHRTTTWSQEDIDLLRIVSDALSNLLMRVQAERERLEAYHELESRVRQRTADLERTTERLEEQVLACQRTQQALHTQRTMMETSLDHLPARVSFIDQDLRWVWLNQAECDQVGLPREALIGRHCYEHTWQRDTPCPDCPVVRAMRTQQVQEAERTRPDGRRWVSRAVCMRDESGAVVGGVGVSLDITDRKRAERELVRAERLAALGRVSASLAHEINNPLQIIQAHLDLVMDFPIAPDERQECLHVVRSEIERLSGITKSVLMFARPQPDDATGMDVARSIQEVVTLARKRLELANVGVTADLDGLPRSAAVPEHFTVVLLNLVINAAQAMHGVPDARLHIGAAASGEQVAVTLTYNGPPIPQDDPLHVFEPSYATKPDSCGLWVSRALLGESGSIEVRNLEDGRGVSIIVTAQTHVE